jgi:hypothetical protein
MKLSLLLLSLALSTHAFAEGGGVAGNGGDDFFTKVLAMVEANDNNCQTLIPVVQAKADQACQRLDLMVSVSARNAESIMTEIQYRFYNTCCKPAEL